MAVSPGRTRYKQALYYPDKNEGHAFSDASQKRSCMAPLKNASANVAKPTRAHGFFSFGTSGFLLGNLTGRGSSNIGYVLRSSAFTSAEGLPFPAATTVPKSAGLK